MRPHETPPTIIDQLASRKIYVSSTEAIGILGITPANSLRSGSSLRLLIKRVAWNSSSGTANFVSVSFQRLRKHFHGLECAQYPAITQISAPSQHTLLPKTFHQTDPLT